MPDCRLKGNRLKKKSFTFFITFLFTLISSCTSIFAADFYWENPRIEVQEDSRFPITVSYPQGTYLFWQEIDTKKKEIWLSLRNYQSNTDYFENKRFAGPFVYSGDAPDIYSAAVLDSGIVSVAVVSGKNEIQVLTSADKGQTFQISTIRTENTVTAPRIFGTASDNFRIFASITRNNSFILQTATSPDGKNWSQIKDFSPSASLQNPFVPFLIKKGNKDFVIFQAQYISPQNGRLSYQLFSTVSQNNGNSWSEPALVTNEKVLTGRDKKSFYSYQNQRPVLYNYNEKIYMAWEQTDNASSHIRLSVLDENGLPSGENTIISEFGNASRPKLFEYDGSLYLVWFDTRRGKESVYLSKKSGAYWDENIIVENNYSNMFASPLIFNTSKIRENLSFVWQQASSNANNICILTADYSVKDPSFTTISYKKGKKSSNEKVQIQVDFPTDSSGIAGFSWIWSQNPEEDVPEEISALVKDRKLTLEADAEGDWYLKVKAVDYAGNWSKTAEIKYERDLTPPSAVAIKPVSKDKYGLPASNSFRVSWENPPEDDVSGYSYQLTYLGALPKKLQHTKEHPLKLSNATVQKEMESILKKYDSQLKKNRKLSSKINTTSTSSQYYSNRQNGIYLFTVCAVDEVGNIGPSNSTLLILNKYEAKTTIKSAESRTSKVGETFIDITGTGFTYDGTITKIYLDKDGKAPYDFEALLSENQYKVVSDTKIEDLRLMSTLEEGKYRICLLHSSRGLYVSPPILSIEQNGTLKVEAEYHIPNKLRSIERTAKYRAVVNILVIVLIFVLIVSIFLILFISIIKYQQEKAFVKKGVQTLMSKNYKNGLKDNQKKEHLPSLKTKLTLFTIIVIFLIIVLLSLQNGLRVVKMQTSTLSSSLQSQIDVLMESLTTGVKNFMPANNILEMTSLPAQKESMREIKYITIVGQKAEAEDDNTELNYLWASNDPEIQRKVKDGNINYGNTKIKDESILEITSRFDSLNENAVKSVGILSDMIAELTVQASNIAAGEQNADDMESLSSRERELRTEINNKLSELSKENSGSIPHFDSENLDFNNTDYIFYKPVLYRKGTSNQYVHAVIIVELSSQSLIDSVLAQIRNIIITALSIAAIAIIIGAVSAYILASVIVKPIKKLESYLNLITETADKEKLEGHQIEIKAKDEIGRLGDSVNDMVNGLIKASQEEKLMMDGKAVQQAFIPLLDKNGGGKQTIAKIEGEKLSCFGYYEGASGVSGDYFDFKQLDSRWAAFVKCDASGHGVPAAIIMTVVATLFRRHFEQWSYEKNGISIAKLVIQINDFVESLGIRGKFAAMICCLMNTDTGECYMCNAGDNIFHLYDGDTHKISAVELTKTPVVGPFASFMISPKNIFRVEKINLKKNDVLFLYTDGIEESKRYSRTPDYEVIMQPDPDAPDIIKEKSEELSNDRIHEIVNAVFSHGKFVLEKTDNPATDEKLEFDFSDLEGSIDDAVIALVSVEKVFRMYKSPDVQKSDYIQVDKRIDQFLQTHFNLYDYYCSNKVEISENSNYFNYEYLKEDIQEDDLTLIAIKRR